MSALSQWRDLARRRYAEEGDSEIKGCVIGESNDDKPGVITRSSSAIRRTE
jgi:hypothetical protein